MKNLILIVLLFTGVHSSAQIEIYNSNPCEMFVEVTWINGSCEVFTSPISHVSGSSMGTVLPPGSAWLPWRARVYTSYPPIVGCLSLIAYTGLGICPPAYSSDSGSPGSCCPGAVIHTWWDIGTLPISLHIN